MVSALCSNEVCQCAESKPLAYFLLLFFLINIKTVLWYSDAAVSKKVPVSNLTSNWGLLVKINSNLIPKSSENPSQRTNGYFNRKSKCEAWW